MNDELKTVSEFYENAADKVWHVECTNHHGVIAIEALMDGEELNPMHAEGALVIPLVGDNQLLSYRKRSDGTMGYSCSCGLNTIKLNEEQIVGRADMTLPHIKAQITKAINQREDDYRDDQRFKRIEVK